MTLKTLTVATAALEALRHPRLERLKAVNVVVTVLGSGWYRLVAHSRLFVNNLVRCFCCKIQA